MTVAVVTDDGAVEPDVAFDVDTVIDNVALADFVAEADGGVVMVIVALLDMLEVTVKPDDNCVNEAVTDDEGTWGVVVEKNV